MHLNTEKSYLIGLLIGGGITRSDTIQIVLPYKKWGDLKVNPERGGGIAEDILKRAKPLWKQNYNVEISYKIDQDWKITFNEISEELKKDLDFLGLNNVGEFRNNADIGKLIPLLDNEEKIRAFIAGIVDTVGSLAKSHRRFSDEFQIVSLEFKGRNFELVRDISNLLIKINCLPDQVLWNHPNQHSGLDRYYRSWKKGFKIRVALGDYILRGSFVFESKQLSANENRELQKKINTTIGKKAVIKGRTALHIDENSIWIPQKLRGLHFIHYTHIAQYLGLKLPQSKIEQITNFEQYVSPFTLLTKGDASAINAIIESEDYLKQTKFNYIKLDIDYLIQKFESDGNALIFGNTEKDGFPVNYLLQGIAYVFACSDPHKMKGKRILGSYIDLIKSNSKEMKNIYLGIPNKGTCIHIKNDDSGALIGYVNNEFTKSLISVDGLKLKIRSPKFNECLVLK